MTHIEKLALARSFHASLSGRDWAALRSLLDDRAEWKIPGGSLVSGHVVGAEAIVKRLQEIGAYGVKFSLEHILVSAENVALALHNTACRGALSLDVHLATVCFIRDRKIASIETFTSDVEQVNAFFA